MLTSYYGKVSRLPNAPMQPIGISVSQPRWLSAKYPEIRELAPGPWFRSVSTEEYIPRYLEQLSKLKAEVIWEKAHEIANGLEPVILCWESPGFDMEKNFCHRRLAAHWLESELSSPENIVQIPEGYVDGQGFRKLIPNWDSADLSAETPQPMQISLGF